MNNLEFIEKCIKETKRSIEHWKEQLKRYPEEEVLTRCLNTREIELQAFQEVKTQLEAWEVVKPSIHHIKEQRCFVIHNIYRNKQYDFIMKSLKSTRGEK